MEGGGFSFKVVSKGEEELLGELLDHFLTFAKETLERKGVFMSALAGGRTPEGFYRLLSRSYDLWEKSYFFPTDERFVSSEDTRSNYWFLRENLGERARLYRVKTELPLKEACRDFDRALEKAGAMDFTLLGMGEDGHVASIFPERECRACGKNACTSTSPDGLERVSMSLEYLNLSGKVAFLVLGERKRRALEMLLKGENIPATRLRGREETLLFTDLL